MEEKKIRIGVVGGLRGSSMINYCKRAPNAQVVAICDNCPQVLEAQKIAADGLDITFYDDFEVFLNHDMDAVVLANYATEHAPFAIKALSKGLHVFSEVTPCQNMQEAVQLIEAVEKSGKIYAYGENYCYMGASYEMRKLYKAGKLGEFEYAEGEYIHNGEPIWHSITYGERDHWRNRINSTYYCTHSLGPIIHATGLRPVSVIGFESVKNERKLRVGARSGQFAIEMVTLENGGMVKSIHGWLYENSIWWTMYGSKGRFEIPREESGKDFVNEIYVRTDKNSGEYKETVENYKPTRELDNVGADFGHGGSDFYTMWNFVEKIKGNPEADIIDVYEAMDMFLPGIFAYFSILNHNVSMDIPNLRDKKERDKWRNNTACTDPQVAKEMLLPSFSKGTPVIEEAIYDHVKALWKQELNKENGDYRAQVFKQGMKK